MVVNGNIKKIMYMGEEISKVMYANTTIWEKQTVKPPPGPKSCTTCQTSCERKSQCTCQSGESCLQQCGNCLSLCQNNQGSDM